MPAFISVSSLLWQQSKPREKLLEAVGGSTAHGTSTAWNHIFSQRREFFARLTMKDGRVIGGYYGEGSFAAYSEEQGDLFLSERWSLDEEHWFEERAEGTGGLWAAGNEIVSIEIYSITDDEEASSDKEK
jgi:hypothetical protein